MSMEYSDAPNATPLSFDIKKANLEDKTVIEYGEIIQSSRPHTCFVIPGAFSTACTWEEPARALMERNNGKEFGRLVCITPFGMNGSCLGENSLHQSHVYADFIEKNFPDESLTVIAHSKADVDALFLCNDPRIKDRLRRLVIVSPIMTTKEGLISLIIKSIRSLKIFDDLPKTARLTREAIRTSLPGILHHIFTTNTIVAPNLVNFFRAINTPVFIVGSENDIISPAELKEFADYFPHADVKILKDGGHHFPLYHPGEFGGAVWDWIESQYSVSV